MFHQRFQHLSFLCALFLTSVAFAGSSVSASRLEIREKTDQIVSSALSFVESTQTQGGLDGYDPGQWPTLVTSSFPSALGVGKMDVPFHEPSAFGASIIANLLAEMYELEPRLTSIPKMIRKTTQGFRVYEWGPVYHFYPPKTYMGLPIRGPRHMYLSQNFKGFANTPPDADTTSVANLTLAYLASIEAGVPLAQTPFDLKPETVAEFVKWRDVNRTKPHLYNQMKGWENTGAYLTWLWDEHDPNEPKSYLARPDKGTRIPFNHNDVDCVVATNVIKVLEATGRRNTPGYAETCRYLNEVIARKGQYTCGMYYPSHWVLPYTMATALDHGVSCLEPSREALVKMVMDKQYRVGAFRNRHFARADLVQSTVWALGTLLALGNPQDQVQRKAAQKAIKFLLSQASHDQQGRIYWPGEVFFAATFVARFPVVWRSDAYTTASVAKVLLQADRKWKLHY